MPYIYILFISAHKDKEIHTKKVNGQTISMRKRFI